MSGRVILLEFNELVPSLMDRFIAEEALPTFERFRGEAEVHVTEADEDHPFLEPWIQWITVHSGLSYREHRIQNLGDGHKLDEPNVWDVVSEHGDPVWICGSMNAQYRSPLRGWVLPDPWTAKVVPQPREDLEPYFKFISAHVTDYTAGKVRLGPADYARFLLFMARHGLSRETVQAIATQLAEERLRPGAGWKRAVILDKLQFDLFESVYRRIAPRLSTFFLNSTAHYQHLYWRDMEPEQFAIQPDQAHLERHEASIRFGYQQMDRLLARFLQLAGPDVTVVFCTAISQQACTVYDDKGGKTFYRPKDFRQFLQTVGVTAQAKVAPVMSQQFHVELETEEAARDAEAKLRALQYDGRGNAMNVERNGRSLFGGCRVFEPVKQDAVLRFAGSERTVPFYSLFYGVDLMKSGMHHRDGMLWIRHPSRQHRVHPDKVPLAAVAPTLLQILGLPQPASMTSDPIGARARRVA